MKNLASLGGLLDGALKRHNIGKQITAARVVGVANEELAELLSVRARADIKALSIKDNVLTLACRHSAAMYDAEGAALTLERILKEKHGAQIAITVRLKPEIFNRDERAIM